jgi:hypothetical protein
MAGLHLALLTSMLRTAGVIAVVVACATGVAEARQQGGIHDESTARFSDAIRVSFAAEPFTGITPPAAPFSAMSIDALDALDALIDKAQIVQQGAQAPKPPQPEHTGLPAMWHSSISDFKEFPRRKSTWIFLGMGALAALAVHPADHAVNQHLVGNETASRIFTPGKYLGGFTQFSVGVGMYVIGRYALDPENGTAHTNKWSHLGFDLVRAQILTQAFTLAIKQTVRRDRPTGECCSFPSGHSSATFATAAVLERHLGLRGAWPTVVVASYVAISRLHDNRHFLSDVVFGAALGTATGWTVVGRHGRSSYVWMPVKTPGGMAIVVAHRGHP